jgi:hypothetical protein
VIAIHRVRGDCHQAGIRTAPTSGQLDSIATASGDAAIAPRRSPSPRLTAAVVPPQNGHGMPVSVRSGQIVIGRRDRCTDASVTATTATAA